MFKIATYAAAALFPLFVFSLVAAALINAKGIQLSFMKEKNETELAFAFAISNYVQGLSGLELLLPLTAAEVAHLYDIKVLIQKLYSFLAVVSFALVLLLYFANQRLALIYGSTLTGIAIALLLIIPFDILFYAFHAVSFAPETYIFLDSVLPKLFPPSFFENMLLVGLAVCVIFSSVTFSAAVLSGQKFRDGF